MNAPPLCPGCFLVEWDGRACASCGYVPDAEAYHSILEVGTRLADKYEVGRVLGKPGGFGITYLAFDLRLRRRVALKELMPRELVTRGKDGATLHPHSREEREVFRHTLSAFLEEARTLARFSHPNVVRVLDYFEANETAYFAMEFYEGTTLSEHVESLDRALTADEALVIARPLLAALGKVHDAGVLHRDIKPSNVYLTEDGRPVLLDFGSARQSFGVDSRTLTSVLTPGYAPFEQYHGRGDQGPWTDVYGAAATLYFLLTRTAPPEAGRRIEGEPLSPPETLAERIPPALSAAIVRGLAMRPDERPRSAAAFLGLLEDRAAPSPAEDPSPDDALPGTVLAPTVLAPADLGAAQPTMIAPTDATALVPHGGSDGPPRSASVQAHAPRSLAARLKGRTVPLAGAALLAVALPVLALRNSAGDGPDPADPVTLVGPRSGDEAPAADAPAASERADAPGAGRTDERAASGRSPAAEPTTGANGAGGDRSPARRGPAGAPERDPGTSNAAPPPRASKAAPARPATGVVVLVFGDPGTSSSAETTLLRALLRVPELTPMDAGSLQMIRGSDAALRSALRGDLSRLAQVGREQGAAYIIVGDLTTSTRPARGSFHSGTATLDLKLYRASTGALVDAGIFRIGSGGVPARSGLSPDAAVSEAVQAVAQEGASALTRWVRRDRR